MAMFHKHHSTKFYIDPYSLEKRILRKSDVYMTLDDSHIYSPVDGTIPVTKEYIKISHEISKELFELIVLSNGIVNPLFELE